jgi:predicted esterase
MRWWRRSAVEALVIAGSLSPAASVATVDHAGTAAAAAAHDDARPPAGVPSGATPGASTEAPDPIPPAAPSTDARLALSPDGHFGAWLVAGPFDKNKRPDEERFAPRLGAPIGDTRWILASATRGPLDLVAALDAHVRDRIAYAAGVMHIERAGRHVLLLGVDDGVSVLVDGKRVFTHDEARPLRDDDDLVPLDLAAGDHTIVLVLHQWIGAWVFRARMLDPELEPPLGARWVLPGAAGQEATLASRMSVVAFDRGLAADGYHPVVTVRYPEGAPVGADLGLRARLVRKVDAATVAADAAPADEEALFDVDAGQVPIGDRGVADLSVALPRVAADEVEDHDWNVHAEVAGRSLDLPMHPRRAVRDAVAHAERALAEARADPSSWLPASAADSVEFLRDRLVAFVARGDGDLQAQADDARELEELASAIDAKRDPYAGRTGPMRRAYRSPADGKLSEFALYVPPGFKPSRKYPLIVALHGMNGRPMEMLMWLFGHDDPDRDGNWEDRHPRKNLEPLDAIVVAPDGHFNAMYRDLGEEDVMRVADWAAANYPIDASRVTVTGPSMGGIGSAACALHHPDRFAAAEPLCGYHSLLIRELGWMRPWERFLAEVQSNVLWAENGQYLPLYIVHGTKDLPEENSGVLIDRYDELHYDVKHEHPELGHNVWQPTYEDLKGAKWLLDHRRPMHPRALRFKTARTRWGDDAWLHVRELSSSTGWGEVFARVDKDNVIRASAHGVAALAFDRDPALLDDAAAVTVGIDQSKLTFQAGEPIELYRDHGAWKAGPAPHEGDYKHGTVTGPIRDVFHEPLLFVWGSSDPAQARANEETARGWARVRNGVHVDYPVMSDAEFFARGEPIANDRALFLVGNARSNRVVRELEPSFPIRVDGDDIVLGATRIQPDDGPAADSQLGAVFIRPNPRRSDRYVVVVEGVGPLGAWRSLSLPEMLPDYVVFDHGVEASRGLLTLGAGTPRAAGSFANDWSLPSK